jgi:hypothetical protein
MNDVDDSDHELTDEQRDKLRKAIGEIIGDFTLGYCAWTPRR